MLCWTLLCPAGSAIAADPHSQRESFDKILASTVRLSGRGSCGTGFITEDGALVTATHLVEKICPLDDCSAAKVDFDEALKEPPIIGSVKIDRKIPGIDISILSTTPRVKGLFKMDRSPLPEGSGVSSAHFAGCGGIISASGTVTQSSNIIIATNLTGAPGASGAPLWGAGLQIGGVITRAFSPSQAVLARLIGMEVSTAAVPAQLIIELLNLEHKDSVLRQIHNLNQFYKSSVITQSGRARLLAAFTFLSATGSIRSELADLAIPANHIGAIFSGSGLKSIANNTDPPSNELAQAAELLAAAADVEAHGLLLLHLKGLNSAAVVRSISQSSRTAGQQEALQEIIFQGTSSTYQGFYLAALGSLLVPLTGIILIFALWCWSAGYVFCKAKGGIVRRSLAMTIVALPLWPFSFFYFLFSVRKERRKPTAAR